MGAPKPCLGYRSRTEAVMAMRAQGMDTRAIASRIGIELKTVTALEGSAARSDRARDRRASTDYVHVDRAIILPVTLAHDLREPARKRRLSVERLAIDLLEAIAADDLVEAVLDDRPNGGAHAAS